MMLLVIIRVLNPLPQMAVGEHHAGPTSMTTSVMSSC